LYIATSGSDGDGRAEVYNWFLFSPVKSRAEERGKAGKTGNYRRVSRGFAEGAEKSEEGLTQRTRREKDIEDGGRCAAADR
jgi:hypothetical protein